MKIPSPMHRSGFRLLIVEDDEMNRFVLEKLLRATGCEFSFARSGEEALFLFQNGMFDLILMDIELPGMNGYQTAEAIRKTGGHCAKRPLILAMTSHQKPDELSQDLKSAMDGWLVKPFGMEQLEAAIEKSIRLTADSNMRTAPVINLDTLNSIAGNDPEFVQLCIEIFLREMPENLTRLNSAIESCDWETVWTTSHKMKSSLNYMGLNEERAAALTIEKLARDRREIDRIKSDAKIITAGCRKAFGELQLILNRHEKSKP